MSNRDYSGVHPSLKSGLTGGAATGHGVAYQTWYAVYVALKLISRLLRDAPIQRPMLVIEPRIMTDESLSRWDMRTTPDGVATEVKARPAKRDLFELLERCRHDVTSGNPQTFELVYGESNAGFLEAIEKLIRLATESAGAEGVFDKLCELEVDDGFQELLRILGSAALAVGQRLTLKPTPEHLLHDAIDCYLQFLFPPCSGRTLKTHFVRSSCRR